MASIPRQRVSSPVLTPASLTQAGAAPLGHCPSCRGGRVTALSMTLTDGTPVTFVSCHDCEHRAWNHDGVALEFTDVLARATKQKV